MQREWYLIDDEGIHRIDLGVQNSTEFWDDQTEEQGRPGQWPGFSQLVVDASASRVVEALKRTAPLMDVGVRDVTASPEHWEGGVLVAQEGEISLVTEPGVDLDERVLGAEWAEELMSELRCAGAFVGYEPHLGSLHLTMYQGGRPTFAWCDSLLPGPSYAMVFESDGRCTHEDPRRFALRMLDLPLTSPLLDRYHFVRANLRSLGLEELRPELETLPIAAAMQIREADEESA
ncbi:hypothetical protein DL240_10225 [Lujinxingia litoralis]|uniref:Uncharacterized protein n=1 Tax=Lujinxingia litoralis TaxID=2211119 RepID=A0A328C751_9DELT|nr:hypothetical protein [Lujinxingia litoralis]RAL22220.1 hypothetical protein DL240_10225 [Lujinxingia litoralis]